MSEDVDRITMYSDYVCPFCYLGRQSLDEYRSARGEPLAIDWRPFDLRSNKRGPDGKIDHSVDDGKDEAYYERARENVERLQEEYDVEMRNLDEVPEVDSLNAQLASTAVQSDYPEQWEAFDEAIFTALWLDGRDIGDPEVLADLAREVGLDPTEIRAAIEDDAHRERVTSQFSAAQQRGVTGVPTFVYDGHAARGAVPPEHLRRLVEPDAAPQ